MIISVLTSGLYIHAHTQACLLTHANTHTLKNKTALIFLCCFMKHTEGLYINVTAKEFLQPGAKD